MTLEKTRAASPVHPSYAKRDQLPIGVPIIGDRVSYCLFADGSDPVHHTTALRRLREGRPVYYEQWMECETAEDRKDARAILAARRAS